VLGWLRRIVGFGWSGVTDAIKAFVHTVVGGIAGVVSLVFHAVTGAWDELTSAAAELENGAHQLGRSLWHKLSEIVGYWIPHFAFTAWWWVTHPDQLARTLLWYLVAALEREAWTAGQYLGEFGLALFTRNLRRFLHVLEHVFTAVL
jgi:hypothetical protein